MHTARAAVLLLVFFLAPAACAQEGMVIKDVQWGFDGKACERSFTPLSILIENVSPDAIEGKLRLTKFVQLNQQIDAAWEQEFYVSPLTSRWVQITPYVIGDYEAWRLQWGPGRDQRYEVPTPRVGERATVLIYDPEDVQGIGGVLRRFDQALFPTSVTGADTLRGLVMDRVPQWQGARVQAFLDWLRRGGRVYLLHDAERNYPRFPESLAVLNGPEDRYRVGSGVVMRVPLRAEEVDYDAAQSRILRDDRPDPSAPPATLQQALVADSFGNLLGWDRDRQLFVDLEIASRFHRNWWFVYLAVLAYLAAVYPGCYLVGRKQPDWRLFYAAFLGAAAVFSVGFLFLGRVGSAEVSRARTCAIARQLEDGLYDVTQWSCVAALEGRDYDIQHAGGGRLYSTAQEFEAVLGTISTADGGRVTIDMPPVSTRTLIHRARLPGRKLGVQTTGVDADELGLSALTIRLTGRDVPRWERAYAAYRDQVYELTKDGTILTLKQRRGTATVNFLTQYEEVMWNTPAWRMADDEVISDEDVLFAGMFRLLVGNSFGLERSYRPEDVRVGDGLVRVFLYGPLEEEFRIAGDDFTDQGGRVLYVIDLPVRTPQ